MSDHVIVMTRLPVAGRTKTRLEGRLGPEGCAVLHRAFLKDQKDMLEALDRVHPVSVHVFYDGPDAGLLDGLVPGSARRVRQQGESLGRRMMDALQRTGQPGDRILLIGSDSPQIHRDDLLQGFALLDQADLVFGPALDGGYYLLGVNAPCPDGLTGPVDGPGGPVLPRTLEQAGRAGLKTALLRPLRDLDEPQDLDAFVRETAPAVPGNGPYRTLQVLADLTAGRRE